MSPFISRLALTLTLAASCTASGVQAAVEVRGVTFEDSIQMADQTLRLNGAGVRVRFLVIDVYSMGLYVATPSNQPQQLIEQPGPKSARVTMLFDVDATEFVDALEYSFTTNNKPEVVKELAPQLATLKSIMGGLGEAKVGLSFRLDYLPGIGTRVIVNGEQRGADIPGEDFYRALLRIWLGDDPADPGLKTALLGAQRPADSATAPGEPASSPAAVGR